MSGRTLKAVVVVSALVAATSAMFSVGGAAVAWGPSDRETFTIGIPAPYITFNSITDNPLHGDERNFVQVKSVKHTESGGWVDTLAVEIGEQYWVRTYVHNNAAENLNLVAQNTRITASIPGGPGDSITIGVKISADNATPGAVWDEAVFTSDVEFRLAYINDSAEWNNNVFVDGTPIDDTIIEPGGALLGYSSMNGEIPGCFAYDGVATFKVLVQAVDTSPIDPPEEPQSNDATVVIVVSASAAVVVVGLLIWLGARRASRNRGKRKDNAD